jgi:prepilin-type processing-associated H-X9-DG protein
MSELPPASQPAGSSAGLRSVETSGSAIASLVLGIFALCTCGLTAIPGLILGLMGLRSVRRGQGMVAGRSMAIAGIVLSAIGLSLLLLAALFSGVVGVRWCKPAMRHYRPSVQVHAPRASPRESAAQSMISMKLLASAARDFAEEHEGRFPSAEEYPGALSKYLGSGETAEPPPGRAFAMNEALAGVRVADLARPERTVLLFETAAGAGRVGGSELLGPPAGKDGDYVIAFADGHVEWVSAADMDNLVWEPEGKPAPIPL